MAPSLIADSADRLLAAFDQGTQLAPLSNGAAVTLQDAYEIAAEISARRVARGERIVGRKIGFTNRTIWQDYGVDAPMWAPMYDTSVAAVPVDGVLHLPKQAEPRIEPEIAFHIAKTPRPGMSQDALAACIDWMAHGFEIVTSPFPNWRFRLPDCTAAQALHACFWFGPPVPLPDDLGVLEQFSLTMDGPRGQLQGHARDVLDGPLHALRFLVETLESQGADPIKPGEIVTTGTLTDAGAVASGETWRTAFSGLDLSGLTVRFA
jgi:2-oxo-3-hexenedioate decarboxylase